MEPEGSLQCSQEPPNGSYPKSDASSPHLLTISLRSILILYPFLSVPKSSTWSLPFRFTNQPVVWIFHLSTGWTIGWSGFKSQQGLEIFLFDTMSRLALGPTQPPIQWVPGALSLGVKQLGHEADHSPSHEEVKECMELYLCSRYTLSLCGTSLSPGTPLPLPWLLHAPTISSSLIWSP